jgi:dolichyl-diphosphooligosaccharide--protein glycosyltransferase
MFKASFILYIHTYIRFVWYGVAQVFYGVEWVRGQLDSPKLFRAFLKVTVLSATTVGVLALAIGMATGYISPWTGRFYSLLDPTYAKDHIPIIASVSEHQPTAWSSFMFDFHVLLILFPAGLYFCFKRLTDATIFVIIYGLTSMYFAGVMVRLILVAAPAVCLISAIAISASLKNLSGLVRAKAPAATGTTKISGSGKGSNKVTIPYKTILNFKDVIVDVFKSLNFFLYCMLLSCAGGC